MKTQTLLPVLALSLGALTFSGIAASQSAGVVNLTANRTSATGSFEPVLTWSTNPTATSCRASGGWSGTKAASGRQVIPTINMSVNYTLTCTWGTGSATVTWNPPTTNTNGTPLTNLARFKVRYGTNSAALDRTVTIDDPSRRSHTINSLSPATWYFAVRAVNASNIESADSTVRSKAVAGASASRTVSISIPRPPAGSLRTVATNVWDVYRRSDGLWLRRAVVGQIALGRPCSTAFRAGEFHYVVNRSDVRLYATPQSSQLVVNCSPG